MTRHIDLKLNMKGEDVKLLHQNLVQLGFDIPIDELTHSFFGSGTKKAVKAFQKKNGLKKSGIVNEQTDDLINREFEEKEEKELEEEPEGDETSHKDKKTFIVKGHVVSHELIGLPNLKVVAVDKNVGADMKLGIGKTGELGAYQISYRIAKLRKCGKLLPDVQIQVFAGGERVASSDVRYNAGQEETIDVLVPEGNIRKPSEYRRLLQDLALHLCLEGPDDPALQEKLSQLQEDENRQDITYLANKTGWDARLVALAVLAVQFSLRTNIRPEFFYALFRSGLPADDIVLSQTDPETLQLIWNQAVEQAVIPEELKDLIPEVLDLFKAFAAERLLKQPPLPDVSSLNELLDISLSADDNRKQQFSQLYYEKSGDLDVFWESVRQEFGENVADRLQLVGRLGLLTVNNANLIQRLNADNQLQTPLDLVKAGFYRPDAWGALVTEDITIPEVMSGEDVVEKRNNYMSYMANQLRLTYPTAVIAEMVQAGEIPLQTDQPVKVSVYQFLTAHQGQFELGVHPIEDFLRKQDISLDEETIGQLKKLQRVYQISASDEIMGKLVERGFDSAHAIITYDEQSFVDQFKEDLGGEAMTRLTYAKAHQVHHTVLNVAASFMLHQSAPGLHAIPLSLASSGDIAMATEGTDTITPTLEGLFGEMDFCACEHCRSWLSPAAYLVDLLQFIDLKKYNSEGAELPAEYEKENPLDVLLMRRPDIQHVQLTCENTNIVLPYIDLVNEILEYFVVHGSLQDFKGYNMEEGIRSEELLVNPQFVKDEAYNQLKAEVFPLALPFHQPLEALRRYFEHFEVRLHEVMTAMREDEQLDNADDLNEMAYAWRDILMEQLQLSRLEYMILTDSSKPLEVLYGEPNADEDELIRRLSNVQVFTRKVEITYEELIDITQTKFINPNSHLIPKLEKLGVNFRQIKDLKDGILTEAQFRDLLPQDLDLTRYREDGDIKKWIEDNYDLIMGLIVLSDPMGNEDICAFNQFELRYAEPDFSDDFSENRLSSFEFLKLLRFIRLWKKLGWNIEATDKAITALYPPSPPEDDDNTDATMLDEGFKVLILRLAHVVQVMEALQLNPQSDLVELLACWSPLDTHGSRSLYRRMFLNLAILRLDSVFQEDGYGIYLQDHNHKVVEHLEALRAAFHLTGEELTLILEELDFDDQTALTLENISQIFRFGYLARKLRISVQELLALIAMSGIHPFEPLTFLDPADSTKYKLPFILQFINLTNLIKQSPFKISQLQYFLQHVDLSGKASPTRESVLDFAKTIREDVVRISREHVVKDDPTGEVAKSKMALVYGHAVTDTFFGLLNGSSQYHVTYSHGQSNLQSDILQVTDKIAYDDFQKKLTFLGLMTEAVKTNLENAPSATVDFKVALQDLYDAARAEFQAFFGKFPDLEVLYNNFEASSEPVEKKMTMLLADVLLLLLPKLKRQQVRQTVTDQVDTEPSLTGVLMETSEMVHAVGNPTEPIIADFLGLETVGVSVDYFFADDVLGIPNQLDPAVAGINYTPGVNALPSNPAGGDATISGIWRWYLEVPDNGFYNFYVETDAGAEVSLNFDGEGVNLNLQNGVWRNQKSIDLQAGRLYAVQLIVKKVKEKLVMKWESKGLARERIPSVFLYPALLMDRFTTSYVRFLKVITIAEKLVLSSAEIKHFGTQADNQVNGEGWLNLIPVALTFEAVTIQSLLATYTDLLRYSQLKAELKVRDDSLIQLLENPNTTTEDGSSLLLLVTGWDEADLAAFMGRFGLMAADLTHLHHFIRIHKSFGVVGKLGVRATELLASTTNEPTGQSVRNLQSALRARFDESVWLTVLQPINDELRRLQRDALVGFVLHKLQQMEETQHVDTPDKLFEYFLIDVEMDPCMKTSRIKQAISSVQLFIQRCLLNLEEPHVAASSIKSKQWEWMKRYRVWEANRKVFLYPENWLEPELRDDKSAFFKELESELLQGDITEDTAAISLLHYLEKLDEVSKLEICGMNFTENENDNSSDDIVHVVARTSGARGTYYYRRLEKLFWTPWEKVNLKIEDNPVLPVVWRGRLFLFWLSVTLEGQKDPKVLDSTFGSLQQVTASDLQSGMRVKIRASLSWSEFYNGKWQPPNTSNVNQPVNLGDFPLGSFDRKELSLHSNEKDTGEMVISAMYDRHFKASFTLYNTHSLPVTNEEIKKVEINSNINNNVIITPLPRFPQLLFKRTRSFSKGSAPFSIEYYDSILKNPFKQEILRNAVLYEVIDHRHKVNNIFETPFFFQDRRHVFFVRPIEGEVFTVDNYLNVGIVKRPLDFKIPIVMPILVKPDPIDLVLPREVIFPPFVIQPGAVDRNPVDVFLNNNVYIKQVIGTAGAVKFSNSLIGPGGSIDSISGEQI